MEFTINSMESDSSLESFRVNCCEGNSISGSNICSLSRTFGAEGTEDLN